MYLVYLFIGNVFLKAMYLYQNKYIAIKGNGCNGNAYLISMNLYQTELHFC